MDILTYLKSTKKSLTQAKVTSGGLYQNDMIGWWIRPVAMVGEDSMGKFVFKGGITSPNPDEPDYLGGDSADIVVSEWRANGLPVRSVVVGKARADDHNVPAVMCEKGKRKVVAWSNHGYDSKLHLVVSDKRGSLESLAYGTAVDENKTRIGRVTYAKLFYIEHLSTEEESYYWIMYRVNDTSDTDTNHGWVISEIKVDETVDYGGIIWVADAGHEERFLFKNGGSLGYIATREGINDSGNQIIRFLFGFNPGSGWYEKYLSKFEIDVVTGEITGHGVDGISRNLNIYDTDWQFIQHDEFQHTIENAPTDYRRRFFSTSKNAHLYADWEKDDEDNAMYILDEMVDTNVLKTNSSGKAELPHDESQNIDGDFKIEWFGKIPSSIDSTTVLARKFSSNDNGSWVIRVRTDSVIEILLAHSEASGETVTFNFGVIEGLFDTAKFIGLRFELQVGDTGTAYRLSYSLDNGQYWSDKITRVLFDTTQNNPVDFSTANIEVGKNGNNLTVKSFLLSDWDDNPIVDIDFDNWNIGSTSHTDTTNNVWSLIEDAEVINSKEYVTHELGIAGRRIGHGATANYIPGGELIVEKEELIAVILIKRYEGENRSTLELYKKKHDGDWQQNILENRKQKLARPYQPIGSDSPIGVMFVILRDYGQGEQEFTEYLADTEAISPI